MPQILPLNHDALVIAGMQIRAGR
ncbi:hypothetical protein LCGC14_0030170, partial [marine sediment metagenome]